MSALTQIHRLTTQTQVTTKEIVQTMLSASIGCIAYLRGIFPDDTFFEERYNATETKNGSKTPSNRLEGGQRIMRLQRKSSPGAAELLDYLEHGVYDALQKQHLMSVVFSISVDPRHTSNIHEAYTFQFSYRANASPTIVVQDQNRGRSTTAMPLDAAKRSMQLLFRQLIAMTQSLSPLPEDANKFIALRLFFNEGTPESYQPPGFRAASDREAARFITHFVSDRPHDQDIGSIDTGFHACTLKITTISDLEDGSLDRAQEIKVWDAEHNAKLACHGVSAGQNTDASLRTTSVSCSEDENEQQGTAKIAQELYPNLDTVLVGSDLAQSSLVPTQILEGSQTHAVSSSQRETRSQARCRNVQSQKPDKILVSPNDHAQPAKTRTSTNSINALDTTYNQLSLSRESEPEATQCSTCPAPVCETSTNSRGAFNEKPAGLQGDSVTCECGDPSEDGLMIQCDHCHGWSHQACYGYMQTVNQQGQTHKCYTCLIRNSADLENLRSIAIVRRALHMIWLDGYHCTSTREFGESIGVKDLQTAASILQRLVQENWITPLKTKTLQKNTRRNKKKPTYTVIRSVENERRLAEEYFDPRIGLEDYTHSQRQAAVGNNISAAVDQHEGKSIQRVAGETTGAIAPDVEMPTMNDSFRTLGGHAHTPCTEVICATPEPGLSWRIENRSAERLKTSADAKALATRGRSQVDAMMLPSTATTEGEVDEDLSLIHKRDIHPHPAIHQARHDESHRPTKRVKVSIVKKPVISYAFDTMDN